jgi:transcriptional regulator with XRE-family HTH domain
MQSSPAEIGNRLAYIRAGASQAKHAEALGVPLRTYQNYERGDREPDLRTYLALMERGWNANWLLTGEGPERLDQLVAHVAEDRADYLSQPVKQEYLTIAFQLVDEVADELARQRKPPLSPDKRAAMFTAMCGLLSEGMPQAKVLHFARAAAA